MRMPLMPLLLATLGLAAAPPLKVVVESAHITLGPGREPLPGAAPFQPRLEARFSLAGLPKGSGLRFQFWRATSPALASLRTGRPVYAGATGFLPVEGEVKALEPNHSFQLTAFAKGPWNGPESLVVEVKVKGRLVGRGSAPIVEKNLPGAGRREGMEP